MATKVNGPTSGAAGIFSPTPAKTNEAGEAAKAKAVVPTAYTNAATTDMKRDSANVQISTTAKDRADAQKRAFDIAKATPEIREDKVADIKARIQNGTYQLDSGKIADGMLREAIMEHLADGEE